MSSLLKMSVLIHQDGLSFYTYTTTSVVYHIDQTFKHQHNPIELLDQIRQLIDTTTQLQITPTQVNLIYHHSIFTGVPAAVYQPDHAADYLKYNTQLLTTDVISTDDTINQLDYKTIYIAYSNINNYFYDQYGIFNYYHYTTLALQQHSNQLDTDKPILIIDLKPSHFYITIFINNQLILHNCFKHDAVEDILYYTLFTAQHNQLDPETMQLQIIAPTLDQHLYDLLYTYIRHVTYNQQSTQYLQQLLCV